MSDSENTRILRRCSFCGRSEEEVTLLIPSGDGQSYICDGCINLCAEFIDEQFSIDRAEPDFEELTFDTLPRPGSGDVSIGDAGTLYGFGSIRMSQFGDIDYGGGEALAKGAFHLDCGNGKIRLIQD